MTAETAAEMLNEGRMAETFMSVRPFEGWVHGAWLERKWSAN